MIYIISNIGKKIILEIYYSNTEKKIYKYPKYVYYILNLQNFPTFWVG